MYGILIILVGIIYLAVLELSKNTIIGWIIGIIAVIIMLSCRRFFRNKEIRRSKKLLVFLCFTAILIANLILTGPRAKRLPAVADRKPDVTDTITIPQGQLTGVYNGDHTARVYAGIPYAKAPTGDLRFREPRKAEGWEGVRAFDHFGPMAMQAS